MNLLIKAGTHTKVIPLAKVICFEAKDKYLSIHTADREYEGFEGTVKGMLARVGDAFIRVHRNAIVRTDAIAAYIETQKSNGLVELADGSRFQVARRKISAVRKALK